MVDKVVLGRFNVPVLMTHKAQFLLSAVEAKALSNPNLNNKELPAPLNVIERIHCI
jgi:hypothetical protein